LGRDPTDCNSAAVQNGTVQVVCYKIVLNFGLAAGASFGAFQFIMVVLNVATSLMLKVSKRQTVCIIRTISVIVFLGLLAAIIAIQATSLRVRFIRGNLVTIFQMIVTSICAITFLFVIPWKDIADPEENSPGALTMRNPASERSERDNTFHSDSPQ